MRAQLLRRVKTGCLYDDYARIKRFLLVYIFSRLKMVEDHFWHYGGYIKEKEEANLAQH